MDSNSEKDLLERIVRSEVKLKILEKMEERIKEHMALQIKPVIEDLDEIKKKLNNGLTAAIRENTNFRLQMEEKYEHEKKVKDWWMYIVRAVMVASSISLAGFLWFLIRHYDKIVKLIESME